MDINYERASKLLSEKSKAMQCDENVRLYEAVNKLRNALTGTCLPWDWRYNATHWALNVADLCNEIGYSVAWMRAFAYYYQSADERSAEGLVSYYADNAATRISSCRDKLALLAWSYYCPFNPDKKDEVLNFEQVHARLAIPLKFGLQLNGHEEFLAELKKLQASCFDMAITYRHRKIHRMEPRVMMRKPEESDETPYMIVVAAAKDVKKWDEGLKKMYPNDRLRVAVRKSCHIDGVLFDRRGPKELLWHFDYFDQFAYSCWKSLCDAAAGSCEILLRREPICSKNLGNEI